MCVCLPSQRHPEWRAHHRKLPSRLLVRYAPLCYSSTPSPLPDTLSCLLTAVPRSYRSPNDPTYTGTAYRCSYDPESGALTSYSFDQAGETGEGSDCFSTAATNCSNTRKRGRRAGDPKTKLEVLMSRRPAGKTVESTVEMERRKKVMAGKKKRAAAARN